MKQRLGAVLSVLLGSVLIWMGLAASGTAVAGVTTPPGPATCQVLERGVHQQRGEAACPTGSITVTEVTDLSADPSANPPSEWTVTITSANCTMPNGDLVDQVLTIGNNGNASTDQLQLYGDFSHTITCEYAYVETPEARYTTTYHPLSPQPIPDTGADSNLAVTVTNVIAALPTSASPTHTRTHTATATPTHTRSSSSAAPTAVSSVPASSSAAPILAVTGPRSSVRPSLFAGIGLCGLGLVLLLAGRRPRAARHH